jgi:hypothetical protein
MNEYKPAMKVGEDEATRRALALSGTADQNGNGIPDWQEYKQTDTTKPDGTTIVQKHWVRPGPSELPAPMAAGPSQAQAMIPEALQKAVLEPAMGDMKSNANVLLNSEPPSVMTAPSAKELWQQGKISYDQFINSQGRGGSSVINRRDAHTVNSKQANWRSELGEGYAQQRAKLETGAKITGSIASADAARYGAVGDLAKSHAQTGTAALNQAGAQNVAGIEATSRARVAEIAGQSGVEQARVQKPDAIPLGDGSVYVTSTGKRIDGPQRVVSLGNGVGYDPATGKTIQGEFTSNLIPMTAKDQNGNDVAIPDEYRDPSTGRLVTVKNKGDSLAQALLGNTPTGTPGAVAPKSVTPGPAGAVAPQNNVVQIKLLQEALAAGHPRADEIRQRLRQMGVAVAGDMVQNTNFVPYREPDPNQIWNDAARNLRNL